MNAGLTIGHLEQAANSLDAIAYQIAQEPSDAGLILLGKITMLSTSIGGLVADLQNHRR